MLPSWSWQGFLLIFYLSSFVTGELYHDMLTGDMLEGACKDGNLYLLNNTQVGYKCVGGNLKFEGCYPFRNTSSMFMIGETWYDAQNEGTMYECQKTEFKVVGCMHSGKLLKLGEFTNDTETGLQARRVYDEDLCKFKCVLLPKDDDPLCKKHDPNATWGKEGFVKPPSAADEIPTTTGKPIRPVPTLPNGEPVFKASPLDEQHADYLDVTKEISIVDQVKEDPFRDPKPWIEPREINDLASTEFAQKFRTESSQKYWAHFDKKTRRFCTKQTDDKFEGCPLLAPVCRDDVLFAFADETKLYPQYSKYLPIFSNIMFMQTAKEMALTAPSFFKSIYELSTKKLETYILFRAVQVIVNIYDTRFANITVEDTSPECATMMNRCSNRDIEACRALGENKDCEEIRIEPNPCCGGCQERNDLTKALVEYLCPDTCLVPPQQLQGLSPYQLAYSMQDAFTCPDPVNTFVPVTVTELPPTGPGQTALGGHGFPGVSINLDEVTTKAAPPVPVTASTIPPVPVAPVQADIHTTTISVATTRRPPAQPTSNQASLPRRVTTTNPTAAPIVVTSSAPTMTTSFKPTLVVPEDLFKNPPPSPLMNAPKSRTAPIGGPPPIPPTAAPPPPPPRVG